jgi:hypothetical protein
MEDEDHLAIVSDAKRRYIKNGWMPNRRVSEAAETKKDMTALMSMEGALTAGIHNAIQGYDMFDSEKGREHLKELRAIKQEVRAQPAPAAPAPAAPAAPALRPSTAAEQVQNQNLMLLHPRRAAYQGPGLHADVTGMIGDFATDFSNVNPDTPHHIQETLAKRFHDIYDVDPVDDVHPGSPQWLQDAAGRRAQRAAKYVGAGMARAPHTKAEWRNIHRAHGIPHATSEQETQEAAQEDVSVIEKQDARPQGRPQAKDENIVEPKSAAPSPPPPSKKVKFAPEAIALKKTRNTKKKQHRDQLDKLGIKWRKSWNTKKLFEKLNTYNIENVQS